MATTKPKTPKTPKAPATSAESPLYMARRDLVYGGVSYDRGQLLQLTGLANDERLPRLGYVAEYTGTVETCSECGGQFASAGTLQRHGQLRHVEHREAPPEMVPQQPGESDVDFERRKDAFAAAVLQQEEARDQAAERAADRDAPLNWENTEASRRSAGL